MKQIIRKTLSLMLAVCLCFTPVAGSVSTVEVSAASSGTKKVSGAVRKKMDKAIQKAGVKSGMNKKTALKRLFNYVKNEKNFGYARAPLGFNCPEGWEYDFLNQMLTEKRGSCYHYAAVYAFLAKRATGYPVRICWGSSNVFNEENWQPHAWVEIKISGKWYTFDTNAAAHSMREENGKKIDWYMLKPNKAKKYFKNKGTLKGKINVKL